MFSHKPVPSSEVAVEAEEPCEVDLDKAEAIASATLPLDSQMQKFKASGASETEYALAFEELGLVSGTHPFVRAS